MTQWQRTIAYLQDKKVASGNELRSTLHIVDVPKVISILIRKGYSIQGTRNADGTKTYHLDYVPPKGWTDEDFEWVGNKAVRREEPQQLKI